MALSEAGVTVCAWVACLPAVFIKLLSPSRYEAAGRTTVHKPCAPGACMLGGGGEVGTRHEPVE